MSPRRPPDPRNADGRLPVTALEGATIARVVGDGLLITALDKDGRVLFRVNCWELYDAHGMLYDCDVTEASAP